MQPTMSTLHERSRSPRQFVRSSGAASSAGPAPPMPAPPMPAAPGGVQVRMTRSAASNLLEQVTITNFQDDSLGLAPLAEVAGILKNTIGEAFRAGLMFRLKFELTWHVTMADGTPSHYHMSFVLKVLPQVGEGEALEAHPIGGGAAPSITALLQHVRQMVHDKIDFMKERESGVTFDKIKQIRFTMIPHPREANIAERWGGRRAAIALSRGGCAVKLPMSLINKRCCRNILNRHDKYCFRCCMIAAARRFRQIPVEHPERPTEYFANAPGGRLPRDFVPVFDDVGMDFSMLEWPTPLSGLEAFERVNRVGVYVYTWCDEGEDGYGRMIRTPSRVFEHEVQLLLYKGHYLLVTRFPALMRMGGDRCRAHVCHRCLYTTRSIDKLEEHLARRPSCMSGHIGDQHQPHVVQQQERLLKLPQGAKSIERFRKQEHRFDVPIVVCADFETFQEACKEDRGLQTQVVGKMSGVASFGYYVSSRVPQIPSEVVMERKNADEFVLQMLKLGLRYRHFCRNPVPLAMTENDKLRFEMAERCYMCGCSGGGEDAPPLVRDHDHFTGNYRGAACSRCNAQAQLPKQIVVLFHNLEGFDGHEIVNAIVRLRCVEVVEPDDDDSDEEEDGGGYDDDDIDELFHNEAHGNAVVDRARLSKLRFSILANTTEKYMQISFGPAVFRDSFKFATASLDSLIKSQRKAAATLEESFPILSAHHPYMKRGGGGQRATLDLLLRKVPFAYSSMTDESYFSLPPVLEQRCYDNDLKDEPCSDKDYAMVQEVADHFKLEDQGQYHDLYLYTDVLALADCMEAYRAGWRRHCGLDLFASITLPSASYQAMLKQTGVRYQLITDERGGMELMNLLNSNVRGGASCIFQPFARANNPRILTAPTPVPGCDELHERVRNGGSVDWSSLPPDYVAWCKKEGYDRDEPVSWIVYVDANSLYPTTMTMPLPIGDYAKESLPDDHRAKLDHLHNVLENYTDDSSTGYLLEVSFRVPRRLHDELDYAPIAKREISLDELSNHQTAVGAALGSGSRTKKLVPDLGVHEKVLYHAGLLKFWADMGVQILDVHSVWSFSQTCWMSKYILAMAAKRTASKDPTERDCIKKAMNSLYGKMLQDKASQRNMIPFTCAKAFVKACSRPCFKDAHIMQVDSEPGMPFFALVEQAKRSGILLDSPRCAGFAILELSKLLMLRTHYGFFKGTYGPKAQLNFTDTDSLCYKIETPDVMKDMLKCVVQGAGRLQTMFDLGCALLDDDLERYTRDGEALEDLKEKLADLEGGLGHLKLENKTSFIREFVGLASKMYSLQMVDRDGKLTTERKGKGVPTFVLKKNAQHEDYKRMVFEPYESSATFSTLRSHNHVIEKLSVTKKMLTAFNDKVFQYDQLASRPLGHWRNSSADGFIPHSP